MNSPLGRLLISIGHIVSSLIIGALALATVWIYLPTVALSLFRWATSIRDWVALANWPPRYEAPVRFFFDEHQIVYLVFVIASRLLTGLLLMLLARRFVRRPASQYPA